MREDYHFLKRCFDELQQGQSDGLGGAGDNGVDIDMDGMLNELPSAAWHPAGKRLA